MPIQEEFDQVDACGIDLLSQEHGPDAVRHFGQRAQSGQKVAIAQAPLIHIIGLNTVLKDVQLIVDLTCPLPAVAVVSLDVNLVKRGIVE